MNDPARILVVGGGHVGMSAALRLRRRLSSGEADIVVVEPRPYMTCRPLLPEAASGALSPRHVVVPLRPALSGCRVVAGEVWEIDQARRVATVCTRTADGDDVGLLELTYDVLVLAPGAVTRPRHGLGFRTVEEAVGLRNHVLEQLDVAASTRDAELRAAALTFLFVGAGHAGVGAVAGLEDMARNACRHYPTITPDELRWVLVGTDDRVLPDESPTVSRHTLDELRRRHVDVRLGTRLETCHDGTAALDDGTRLAHRTLVWTAGRQAHPMVARTGLPLDDRGRLWCTATLKVESTERVWAAGDAAAVPDLTRPGHTCAANAQHAARQARVLADNVVAELRGAPPRPYRYAHTTTATSLGPRRGVAQVHGRTFTGWPAWFTHRTYHLSRVPTAHRRARIAAEWTLAGLFRRDTLPLGSLEHPGTRLEPAVPGTTPAGGPPPPDDQPTNGRTRP